MKHTYHIKMRAALWTMLGVAGLVSVPPMAYGQSHCQSYWTAAYKCSQGCGSCGGGGNNAPSRDYAAERRAQEAAAEAERQRQAEADRIERERLAAEKRKNDEFIRNRDATANTLKGSSGGAMSQLKGLAGTDNSGLKGSAFDTDSTGLKGSGIEAGGAPKNTDRKARLKPAPHTDTSVVDARNVPSGLPKGLDNAIASAYSSAPPGVSDRVRKGFQAVMSKDWKVAKAWFQDALNRDPNNAGLKRLVALTDTSQLPNKQPATVDARNEPAGLGGRSDPRGASAPPNKTKPAPTAGTQLHLPDPNDIYISFPGLKAMEDKEALDYLFGLNPYPSASKSGKNK